MSEASRDVKLCPFCNEWIPITHVNCPECGEHLPRKVATKIKKTPESDPIDEIRRNLIHEFQENNMKIWGELILAAVFGFTLSATSDSKYVKATLFTIFALGMVLNILY